MLTTRIFSLLIILTAIFGCTNKEKPKTNKTKEVYIDSLYTFVDFETHNIADPTDVEITADNLIAIADYSSQEITLLTPGGKIISTFGRQGRGPGDFLNIRHLYDLGNRLAVFDSHLNRVTYFDYESELLQTYELPSHAMNKDFTLINDSLYVINMEGFEGHLFQVQSFNSDHIIKFGKPNSSWEDRGSISDASNQLNSGKVPEMFKNKAKMLSDGEYLYVFFEALSEMQKYDLKGNLIWHQEIKLPHKEKIFEGKVERSKKYSSSNSVPVLDYATEFQIRGDELFILTRRDKTKDVKQLLVHVNQNGSIETIYHFPKSHEMCFDFDIDAPTNMLYLTSCLSGNVKRTQLPL